MWLAHTGRGNAYNAARSNAIDNKFLVLTDKQLNDWLLRRFLPRGKRFRVLYAEDNA